MPMSQPQADLMRDGVAYVDQWLAYNIVPLRRIVSLAHSRHACPAAGGEPSAAVTGASRQLAAELRPPAWCRMHAITHSFHSAAPGYRRRTVFSHTAATAPLHPQTSNHTSRLPLAASVRRR